MNIKKQLKKGFTLVEVIIAVTIIGIMSSITVLSYKNYVQTSNESVTRQELLQLAQAFEIGAVKGQFSNSTTQIEYSKLNTDYKAITGFELPFSSVELSYNNNTLTLTRRGITMSYDFNSKTISSQK